MKIDIHTHTKKVKQGDADSRNIDVASFSEIVKNTDVKILAITNHNHFDFKQYESFSDSLDGICQIWPGVEFDIEEENRRAHLIVIVNPQNASLFEEAVNKITGNTSVDSFTISIDEVVDNFEKLDAIFVAHYHSKKPNLLDEDVNKLLSKVSNSKRVLKEASNSISAGIYINHGHNSIHGSDVQDWKNYKNDSKDLPELRLPVESFEQFCLLLDKDDITIKTILNKKTKETIQINPFNSVAEIMDIDIYNDINILFGSKGTGKTDILRALSRHYNANGVSTEVYESNSRKIEDVFDLKGAQLTINLSDLGIDDCASEFAALRSATEKDVTSLSKYLIYYSGEATNKISRSIKINNSTLLDEGSSKREFIEVKNNQKTINDFKEYYKKDLKLRSIIGVELVDELDSVLERVLEKVSKTTDSRFIDYRSISLFNQLINVFVAEISKKTGQPEKPTKTGFADYARNRIAIERNVTKIQENISKSIQPKTIEVGNLGSKGKLHCITNLTIQNGSHSDVRYKHLASTTKKPQKNVAAQIEIISKHIYANSLFEEIDKLKEIESSDSVSSINDLVLFFKHFALGGQFYEPSNGEASMLLLHNELVQDKEIYLIDEPEKSLGNDYISEVIVPLIKEKAKSGKKVIIATHDANIAVRTLPYNSIYREHDIDGYYTYSGNPFTNNLICSSDRKDNLDWKIISMKTLEGGKAAFGERGKIYGQVQSNN